jgi:hypothetical protein
MRQINAAHDERVANRRHTQARILGRIGIRNLTPAEPATWSKYSSSTSGDVPQTDYYFGYVGERNAARKVHIAIDWNGTLLFVRDLDGAELYNHNTDGPPPANWDFSGR